MLILCAFGSGLAVQTSQSEVGLRSRGLKGVIGNRVAIDLAF